jgi:hypothetical protein
VIEEQQWKLEHSEQESLERTNLPTFLTTSSTTPSRWFGFSLSFILSKTANSCISGSRNFIIFLYFIHLLRKLNSLQRCDIAQNYKILHRVVQRLSQHNLKISHHRHI